MHSPLDPTGFPWKLFLTNYARSPTKALFMTLVPRRRFGRTELSMPVFSTGGMRYQQDWKDLTADEILAESTKHVATCIKRSMELGINHIETARGYGTSEWQLGQVLPEYPRDSYILQTKIGIKDSREEFEQTFETSMSKLEHEYVDLLSIHGINTDDELRRALEWGLPLGRKWKREGRIRFFGFSTHGPCDVLAKACYTGAFDYMNVHWYFVNDLNWPAIQMAAAQDMGVFIISPTDKGGRLWDPPQKLVDLCAPLSPMQFNDLYCLSRDVVHTLSLGAAKPSDYDEHVKAMDWYDQRKELSLKIARKIWGEIDSIFGEGWSRTWHVGLPTDATAPGGVHVREIIRLYTLAKGLDLVEYAKGRYNLFGQADGWFPGKLPEQFDWGALESAVSHSPHKSRILDMLGEANDLLRDAPLERQSVAAKKEDESE